MRFEEALKKLKTEEVFIKRKNGAVICIYKKRLYQISIYDGIRYSYTPSNSDLFDDDWETYDPTEEPNPIKIKTFTEKISKNNSPYSIGEHSKSPLPLDVIPNRMGINLQSVDSVSWDKQDDGQLVNLTINFIPDIENECGITEKE